MLLVLHIEITANTLIEAGFELSSFNWEYHLLGLIDGHEKPTLEPMRIVCIMGGWWWCLGDGPLDSAESSSQLSACSDGNMPTA